MHNISDSNKIIVTQFFDALNRGDVAFIVDAYAADGCVQTMGNTLISGVFSRDQVAASAGGIFDVFPNGLTFTILNMVGEGDKVAVEATSVGEHISGQTYSNEYHFLFEFQSGKLIRLKEYMDTERVTDVLCGGQRPLSERQKV
ncbi:nuclear transport factor 2 family protein [Halioglobus sp. Uisw_031]|jgi:ketosteroid isomerase-like protein|uniref:nuclear transport factor 2 family protein n=1 Tax=Halioglobus sp. Uisw_031 TaxID=3230977 RepID=UPI0039EB6856